MPGIIITHSGQSRALSALGAAMVEFQSFISVVYEALKTGKRKDSVKVRTETERETELDFGYSYAGSLGFVFTMHPEEGREEHSSLIDQAVSEFFKFVAIDSKDEVTDFVKRLGSAPVRVAQKWAHAHIAAGLEAQIEWKRDRQSLHRVSRDRLELERLSQIIAAAGEPTMETVEVFGKLVAGNINSRSFQIDIDGKDPIRGRLHRSFNISGSELVLGQMYTARLEKWTRSVIAKGGAQVTYMLLHLRR